MSSSAGLSNVGKGAFYEAGDQRNEPRSVINERERYEEGQHQSHKNIDAKDDRSLANKLAAQAKSDEPSEAGDRGYDPEAELSKRNPEAPAVLHGNEPSKGAKVDHDLQGDDDLRLKEKGLK